VCDAEYSSVRSNYPTPQCRVLLEKLTVAQIVKTSPHFVEPEGILPGSHEVEGNV
jgi:hypothetical protein